MKANLFITARDRGKVVLRREGHNVWLDTGRALLANLISPGSPVENNRIRYMGFGVGGTRQSLSSPNEPPIVTHYPGTNLQMDINQHASRLERPVRFSSSGSPTVPTGTYPTLTYPPTDVFLREVDGPPTFPTTTSLKFTCTISEAELTYGPFYSLGISEIGLFSNAADIHDYAAAPVAYDTFDSIPKTSSLTLQVDWTIRF
jgi:hypothetical protein